MLTYHRINTRGRYEATDPYVRFERAIERVPIAGCWIWLGTLDGKGYGSFYIRGIYGRSHRAAFLLFRGPIPQGACVLHRCDVRCCVNPAHLWLGTVGDNNADRDAKGRLRPLSGEAHGNSKLTEDQVRRILTSPKSAAAMAAEIGIGVSNVYFIRKRKGWKHVAV